MNDGEDLLEDMIRVLDDHVGYMNAQWVDLGNIDKYILYARYFSLSHVGSTKCLTSEYWRIRDMV